MTTLTETQTPLGDHVRNAIVTLDPDHPGFRDHEYRARRNAIAQIAMTTTRSPIPALLHSSNTEFGSRFGKRSAPRTANTPALNICQCWNASTCCGSHSAT